MNYEMAKKLFQEKHVDGWFFNKFLREWPDEFSNSTVYPRNPNTINVDEVKGRIYFEWLPSDFDKVQDIIISLHIDINKHRGYYHFIKFGSEYSESKILNLDYSEDWKWLIKELYILEFKPIDWDEVQTRKTYFNIPPLYDEVAGLQCSIRNSIEMNNLTVEKYVFLRDEIKKGEELIKKIYG